MFEMTGHIKSNPAPRSATGAAPIGRRVRRPIRDRIAAAVRLLLVLLGLVAWAVPARGDAGEGVSVTFSDDLIADNDRPDDLYTAELRLESRAADFHLRLGERMFTRRELGARFDETFVDAALEPVELGSLRITPRIGALRIGKGLLGERAQNEVHGWVGSDPVDLVYVDRTHWYPVVEATLERLFGGREWVGTASVDGYAAFGFRQWLRSGVRLERPVGERWSVLVGAGYQVNRVEDRLLEGAIRDSGPTGELGVAWRGVSLRWSYNEYGTRASALTLGVATSSRALFGGR
jgi:hypothetical protein